MSGLTVALIRELMALRRPPPLVETIVCCTSSLLTASTRLLDWSAAVSVMKPPAAFVAAINGFDMTRRQHAPLVAMIRSKLEIIALDDVEKASIAAAEMHVWCMQVLGSAPSPSPSHPPPAVPTAEKQGALAKVTLGSITELKSLASPPQSVVDMLTALLILLGHERVDRSAAQRFLRSGPCTSRVMETLVAFDPLDVTPAATAKMRPYVERWSVDEVSASSMAAAELAVWVRSAFELCAVESQALSSCALLSERLRNTPYRHLRKYQPVRNAAIAPS